jgi:hypothetical protein
MFLYDSARMGALFGGSFLSWAAFQGMRLLDLPGTMFFVWYYDEGELYNVSRNLLACYRIGAAVLLSFLAGVIADLFLRPIGKWIAVPAESHCSRETEISPTRSSGLAVASVVLALAGVFCLGFLLGFLALLFGSRAVRESGRVSTRQHVASRRLALLGQIAGGIDVVIWTLAMALEIV